MIPWSTLQSTENISNREKQIPWRGFLCSAIISFLDRFLVSPSFRLSLMLSVMRMFSFIVTMVISFSMSIFFMMRSPVSIAAMWSSFLMTLLWTSFFIPIRPFFIPMRPFFVSLWLSMWRFPWYFFFITVSLSIRARWRFRTIFFFFFSRWNYQNITNSNPIISTNKCISL